MAKAQPYTRADGRVIDMTEFPGAQKKKRGEGIIDFYYSTKRGATGLRLPGEPGDPAWLKAYLDAAHGRAQPRNKGGKAIARVISAGKRLDAAIDQFELSAEGKRRGYETNLQQFRLLRSLADVTNPLNKRRFGEVEIGDLKRPDMDEMFHRKAASGGIWTAVHAMKSMRAFLNWAIRTERFGIAKNPAADVGKLVPKSDGFHMWTEAEIAKFSKRHPIGTPAYLAMVLMLYTGVRRSDVIRLGPALEDEEDGAPIWRFVETKNGTSSISQKKKRVIPITKALRAVIEATANPPRPRGKVIAFPGARPPAYLLNRSGKPFTKRPFGIWFAKRVAEAKLPAHCQCHGLRKAGALRVAIATNGNLQKVMEFGGWTRADQALWYIEQANKLGFAVEAQAAVIERYPLQRVA